MIIGVNPVTDVQTVAIQLRTNTFQDISDLSPWDELFHVLVRTVVVGAVGDGPFEGYGAMRGPANPNWPLWKSTGWKDGKAFPR